MDSEGQQGKRSRGRDGDRNLVTLDRVIKRFCPDFAPIRQILQELGAQLESHTEQTDLFFFVPGSAAQQETRRLKLRIEDGKPRCVYYYDKDDLMQSSRSGKVSFQRFDVSDPVIQDVLEAALGVQKTVRKQREIWRQGTAVFNLDQVEDIGKVFELEISPERNKQGDPLLSEYLELFSPYLGEEIVGSNEDLIPEYQWKESGT